MEQLPGGQHPWYGYWWGKLLIGLGIFFLIILTIFVAFTFTYWRQIKNGEKPNLGLPSSGSFTSAGSAVPAVGRVDRARLETTDDPSLGRTGAPVTVVEFIDFKCPNCKAAVPIMDKVIARYGAKVRLIVRDFPVESTHPGATALSELAYCADKEHRFWPVYQALFNEQDSLPNPLGEAALLRLADQTGVGVDTLKTCLATAAPFQEVQADYLAGISAGVRGTPTFFINGEKVEGVIPFEAWDTFLGKVK